jgi:hypothetical protein
MAALKLNEAQSSEGKPNDGLREKSGTAALSPPLVAQEAVFFFLLIIRRGFA